ncbi:hypothetical protein BDZ91DRAFT_803007 [Kalaharituber pfeilii]|nr:hypothetical protein BDZ91DRAFT_803007 [Kalaharituber pfeilii]
MYFRARTLTSTALRSSKKLMATRILRGASIPRDPRCSQIKTLLVMGAQSEFEHRMRKTTAVEYNFRGTNSQRQAGGKENQKMTPRKVCKLTEAVKKSSSRAARLITLKPHSPFLKPKSKNPLQRSYHQTPLVTMHGSPDLAIPASPTRPFRLVSFPTMDYDVEMEVDLDDYHAVEFEDSMDIDIDESQPTIHLQCEMEAESEPEPEFPPLYARRTGGAKVASNRSKHAPAKVEPGNGFAFFANKINSAPAQVNSTPRAAVPSAEQSTITTTPKTKPPHGFGFVAQQVSKERSPDNRSKHAAPAPVAAVPVPTTSNPVVNASLPARASPSGESNTTTFPTPKTQAPTDGFAFFANQLPKEHQSDARSTHPQPSAAPPAPTSSCQQSNPIPSTTPKAQPPVDAFAFFANQLAKGPKSDTTSNAANSAANASAPTPNTYASGKMQAPAAGFAFFTNQLAKQKSIASLDQTHPAAAAAPCIPCPEQSPPTTSSTTPKPLRPANAFAFFGKQLAKQSGSIASTNLTQSTVSTMCTPAPAPRLITTTSVTTTPLTSPPAILKTHGAIALFSTSVIPLRKTATDTEMQVVDVDGNVEMDVASAAVAEVYQASQGTAELPTALPTPPTTPIIAAIPTIAPSPTVAALPTVAAASTVAQTNERTSLRSAVAPLVSKHTFPKALYPASSAPTPVASSTRVAALELAPVSRQPTPRSYGTKPPPAAPASKARQPIVPPNAEVKAELASPEAPSTSPEPAVAPAVAAAQTPCASFSSSCAITSTLSQSVHRPGTITTTGSAAAAAAGSGGAVATANVTATTCVPPPSSIPPPPVQLPQTPVTPGTKSSSTPLTTSTASKGKAKAAPSDELTPARGPSTVSASIAISRSTSTSTPSSTATIPDNAIPSLGPITVKVYKKEGVPSKGVIVKRARGGLRM